MNAFAKVDKQTFYRFMAARREGRYEYVRGRIVQQMTGGTRRHSEVARRITRLLEDQLDATVWTVLPERGVETTATIRYPEIAVEPANEDLDSLSTKRPSVIVEVLSPSTSAIDLDEKPGEYMALGSLDAYLVASQDEPAVLVWLRGPEGDFPSEPTEVRGLGECISISGRGIVARLPLGVIYKGMV